MTKEKGLHVLYDIDGCPKEIVAPLVRHVKEDFGVDLPSYEDTRVYDLSAVYRRPWSEIALWIRSLYFSPKFLEIPPEPGAVEAFKRLFADGSHRSNGVTTRPIDIEHITLAYFARHFAPGSYGIIHHLSPAQGHGHTPKRKGNMALELNGDLFIEDCFDHATDIAGLGIPVLLFNRPWNAQEVLPKGLPITRVFDWPEIVRRIEGRDYA